MTYFLVLSLKSSARFSNSSFETLFPLVSRRFQSSSARSIRKGFRSLFFLLVSKPGIIQKIRRLSLSTKIQQKKRVNKVLMKRFQQKWQKSLIIFFTGGIRASSVTNLPCSFNLHATLMAREALLKPIKRIIGYSSSSKNFSSAKEYPSITSSNSRVLLIPMRCKTGKLNRL